MEKFHCLDVPDTFKRLNIHIIYWNTQYVFHDPFFVAIATNYQQKMAMMVT